MLDNGIYSNNIETLDKINVNIRIKIHKFEKQNKLNLEIKIFYKQLDSKLII